MFDLLKVANHILTSALERTKIIFDEVTGGLLPLARSFRIIMQNIEDEVQKDLKKKPKSKSKPKAKGKRKAA